VPLEPVEVQEMTCKELVELVTDYFEGVLPAQERIRFEKHLSDCGGCRAYLSQMRKTIQIVGRLTEDQIDAEAKEKLLAVFHDWKKGRGQ
jgi:anti-sigma factor RsiW